MARAVRAARTGRLALAGLVVAGSVAGTVAAGTAGVLAAGGPRGLSGDSSAAAVWLTSSQCMAASAHVSPAEPWAQRQLRPSSVWGLTQGAGQTVAVLDAGVSAAAPVLAGAVLPGLNAGTGKSGDTDCSGHGTFVAGLIAARPSAGSGFTGLAPQAQILPVNVLNPNQDSNQPVTGEDVATGIDYAVAHGASVIDVSAAAMPPPSPALHSAVMHALESNVVVIAPVTSSSLSSSNQATYPADYPGVLAVAAVNAAGAPLIAGAAGVRVDLAAPGSQITSIGPLGPGEITGDGAALATGYVAGTAALVRSYYPQLSAAQVVQRLEATADPPGTALPDPSVGYGTVDPYLAVTTVLPAETGGGNPPALAPRAIRLPPLRRPSTWPLTAALLVCGLAILGLIVAAASAYIARSGRSRRWRPPPAPSGRQAASAGVPAAGTLGRQAVPPDRQPSGAGQHRPAAQRRAGGGPSLPAPPVARSTH